MNTPKTFTAILAILAALSGQMTVAGPVYQLDVKSLDAGADLVCGGDVVRVESTGKEMISIRNSGGSTTSYETEVLLARFAVRCVFKGEAQDEITIKCHRNLLAWLPGITQGSCIVYLKKEGEVFVPVRETGNVVPCDEQALRVAKPTMTHVLKATIEKGKRDSIRICLDVLSQVLPEEEFGAYARHLAEAKDDYLRGMGLLHLVSKGDRSVVAPAMTFASKTHEDKELKNLAAEISLAVKDVQGKGKARQE
jgi:hypothetical protein